MRQIRPGGDRRHPGVSGERVPQGGEDPGAVLGGSGSVAADDLPPPGGLRQGTSPAQLRGPKPRS